MKTDLAIFAEFFAQLIVICSNLYGSLHKCLLIIQTIATFTISILYQMIFWKTKLRFDGWSLGTAFIIAKPSTDSDTRIFSWMKSVIKCCDSWRYSHHSVLLLATKQSLAGFWFLAASYKAL